MIEILIQSTLETLYMVFASSGLAFLIGLPLAIILYLTRKDGLRPNKLVFGILDFTINILRSVPFVILMILVMPLSRLIVGKSIGTTASIVPLFIAAAPFAARMLEASFLKIDKGRIEAARSMGSKLGQIIFKLVLPESLPFIINDITITIINLVGYSAMAGSLGGGGLGNMAVRYGLYNYRIEYLFAAVVIIIIMVQAIQLIGTLLSKKINKN